MRDTKDPWKTRLASRHWPRGWIYIFFDAEFVPIEVATKRILLFQTVFLYILGRERRMEFCI